MTVGRDLISELAPDVRVEYLYRKFSLRTLSFFARTCRLAENESRVFRLLHYAVNALPESYRQKDKTKLAAIAMLKLYPTLLFEKNYVQCHLGLIYGSAFQIFLGTGDLIALEEIRTEIIPRIENGLAIAIEQYALQFPYHAKGILYDDRNIAQIAKVKEDLKIIPAAILADDSTGGKATKLETISVLNGFRKTLAPKEGEIIKSGLHSPPEIMKLINEVYEENVGVMEGLQLVLFSCEVFRAAEAVASAVDGQRYNNGLYFIVTMNISLNRTVSDFTALRVTDGQGDEFFIDWYYGNRENRIGAQTYGVAVALCFEEQYQANHTALLTLMQRWQQPDCNPLVSAPILRNS
jgi:hypothetical protein